MRTAALAACLVALAPSASPGREPPKLTDDQLRAEAAQCASSLRWFGIATRAWFPDGLAKAETTDLTGGGGNWPPPANYSWRVAILPAIEQAPVYIKVHEASDGFKIGGNATAAELKKHPGLVAAFERMPEWMTLNRWQKQPGKTVYRRLAVPNKPGVFVVVESDELVPWYSPDDLTIDEKKPLPKFGGNFAGGAFALCADGQVRFLPKTLSDKQLREALFEGKGGSVIRAEKPTSANRTSRRST